MAPKTAESAVDKTEKFIVWSYDNQILFACFAVTRVLVKKPAE